MIKVRRSSWSMLTSAPLKQEPACAGVGRTVSRHFFAELDFLQSGSIVGRSAQGDVMVLVPPNKRRLPPQVVHIEAALAARRFNELERSSSYMAAKSVLAWQPQHKVAEEAVAKRSSSSVPSSAPAAVATQLKIVIGKVTSVAADAIDVDYMADDVVLELEPRAFPVRSDAFLLDTRGLPRAPLMHAYPVLVRTPLLSHPSLDDMLPTQTQTQPQQQQPQRQGARPASAAASMLRRPQSPSPVLSSRPTSPSHASRFHLRQSASTPDLGNRRSVTVPEGGFVRVHRDSAGPRPPAQAEKRSPEKPLAPTLPRKPPPPARPQSAAAMYLMPSGFEETAEERKYAAAQEQAQAQAGGRPSSAPAKGNPPAEEPPAARDGAPTVLPETAPPGFEILHEGTPPPPPVTAPSKAATAPARGPPPLPTANETIKMLKATALFSSWPHHYLQDLVINKLKQRELRRCERPLSASNDHLMTSDCTGLPLIALDWHGSRSSTGMNFSIARGSRATHSTLCSRAPFT